MDVSGGLVAGSHSLNELLVICRDRDRERHDGESSALNVNNALCPPSLPLPPPTCYLLLHFHTYTCMFSLLIYDLIISFIH